MCRDAEWKGLKHVRKCQIICFSWSEGLVQGGYREQGWKGWLGLHLRALKSKQQDTFLTWLPKKMWMVFEHTKYAY